MRAWLVVCGVIATGPVHLARAPQQPTFRTATEVVAVDVRVVDGTGHPVLDLRPDDFVVTVDGSPRTIVTADFISYPVIADVGRVSSGAEPPVVAPSFSSNNVALVPARTVILVVDEENIRAGYGKWAADATVGFVDRLQRNDRVGLVIPKSAIRIAPTTDHAAVKAALSQVVGHMVPVAFGGGMGPAQAFDSHYRTIKEGAKRGELPNPVVEAIVTDVRQRALSTLRFLIALLDSLRTEPGPKTIVVVSEELPVSDHVEEMAQVNPEFTRLGEAAARAQAMLYVLQLDRPLADAEDVRTSSTEQDSSPTRDRDIRSFGLETAASTTGGKRLLASGRPEAPLQRVAFEISGQYLLGIRTEAADRDGKAHRIKVTVKRSDVDVRARQMFTYAAEAAVADRSAADAVNRVLRAATVETGFPMSIATYNLVEPGAAVQMRVVITAEIDRGATKEVSLTVGYAITDGAGRNAGASVEQVTLKPAIGHPDRPLVYLAAAVVPPGSYTLRVAAADNSGRVGSVSHRLEARAAEAGPITLGEIVVFDRYPVDAGKGRPSVSAAVAGVLSGYVEAYVSQSGATPPSDLAARLEFADSADAPARATAPMALQGPDANGRLLVGGSVDATGLPAGDYVARAVFESAGKRLGHTTRPIRIVVEPAARLAAAPSRPRPSRRPAHPTPAA
jgi:VWFA-related protein